MLTCSLVLEVDGQFVIYFAEVGLESCSFTSPFWCYYNFMVFIHLLIKNSIYLKACYYVSIVIGTHVIIKSKYSMLNKSIG